MLVSTAVTPAEWRDGYKESVRRRRQKDAAAAAKYVASFEVNSLAPSTRMPVLRRGSDGDARRMRRHPEYTASHGGRGRRGEVRGVAQSALRRPEEAVAAEKHATSPGVRGRQYSATERTATEEHVSLL